MSADILLDLGRHSASELKSVLPLVNDRFRETNRELLEKLETLSPSLQDQSWGMLAFTIGRFAAFMVRENLSDEQRRALWNALDWAVRYEAQMRPTSLAKRFKELVGFAKTSHFSRLRQDGHVNLESLIKAVDPATLHTFFADLMSLEMPEISAHLAELPQATVNKPVSEPSSLAGPAALIAKLSNYLDRKHEARNRVELDSLALDSSSPAGLLTLSKLGGIVLRSVVQRYFRTGGTIPDADVEAAWSLAPDVVRNSAPNYRAKCIVDAQTIRAIRDTRRRRLSREDFVRDFEAAAADDRDAWGQLVSCVTVALERLEPDDQTKETVTDWIRIVKPHWHLLEPNRQRGFFTQAKRHAPDSLLLDDLESPQPQEPEDPVLPNMKELVAAYKRLDVAEISRILKTLRPHLVAELSRKLAATNPSFDSLLPPDSAVRMPGPRRSDGKSSDRFAEARRLVTSTREEERQRGYEIFEDYANRRVHPDFKALMQEWLLFAKAQAKGLPLVVGDWRRHVKGKTASWEQIWNYAVFNCKIGDWSEALDTLSPGVDRQICPMSHIRFGLYCSLQLLEGTAGNPSTVGKALKFLADNLQLYPLAEAYLLWLSVTEELGLPVSPQQRIEVLAIFQQLFETPLELPNSELEIDDRDVDALERRLIEPKWKPLARTWLLWITDFAYQHSYRNVGYKKLSETLQADNRDVDGALQRADEALQRIVENNARSYERRKQRDGIDDPKYLRTSLTTLFSFYRRNRLDDAKKLAFERFYREAPYRKLWDALQPDNSPLINLTKDLLEAATGGLSSTATGGPATTAVGGGATSASGATRDDAYILEELRRATSVGSIHQLSDRVTSWIDSTIQGSTIAQQRAGLVKSVFMEVGRLESAQWSSEDLTTELARLNTEIARATEFVSEMRELRPLRAVLDAVSTAYTGFVTQTHREPEVSVSMVPPGLPMDVAETSVVVELRNDGPGDITNAKLRCVGDGVSPSRDAVVSALATRHVTTVAIPVSVTAQEVANGQISCAIDVNYDSGVVTGLRKRREVTVPWYDFMSVLNEVAPGAYDLPIPYTEQPIDFRRNDRRLFQGRESHLEQVRAILSGRLRTDPVYYHGIRKVGKSSLLARVGLELADGGAVPFLIGLEGINAKQQAPAIVVNSLTAKIASSVGLLGGQERIDPVPPDHPNPSIALSEFFRTLAAMFGGRRVALLVDEFPFLVAPQSVTILDIIRSVHQEGQILFFFSGWVRPKNLELSCPETQLFPLTYRGIDFLPSDAVGKVLREPLADLRVSIPDSTAERAFALTAGNPYHLAALAVRALNRINAEHRFCVTPQDLDAAASAIVEDDRYFTLTIFSPMIVSKAERETAIAFAKLLNRSSAIPLNEATQKLPRETLDDLREKGIVQLVPDHKIGIKGELLARYLSTKIGPEAPDPAEGTKRVGLFIDIENVRDMVPEGMTWEQAGKSLVRYAQRFGSDVCRWAAIYGRNFADPLAVRMGLERARIKVRRPEAPIGAHSREDRADAALVELIHEELENTKPEVVVISSGDHRFLDVIRTLLRKDIEVRVLSATKALASDYLELEGEERTHRQISGLEQRFWVDTDLRGVLQS